MGFFEGLQAYEVVLLVLGVVLFLTLVFLLVYMVIGNAEKARLYREGLPPVRRDVTDPP